MTNTIDKCLETIAYHSLGIVPLDGSHSSVTEALASLPPDEARKMKRKFRKLWRKSVLSVKASLPWGDAYGQQLGFQNRSPTKRNKLNRKVEVRRRVKHEVVPALKKDMKK